MRARNITKIIFKILTLKITNSPNHCCSVGWATSSELKGHQFDSDQSTGLGCRFSPLGHSTYEGQPIDVFSNISVSQPLFFPPFPSL